MEPVFSRLRLFFPLSLHFNKLKRNGKNIKLTETQLPVLIKIKEYLENNLDLYLYSIHKLKSTQIIMISYEKDRGKSKPLVSLVIKNVHFLNNYLVPFFNEDIFITKKGLDFSRLVLFSF